MQYDDAEESLNDSQSPLLNDYQVPLKTSAAETVSCVYECPGMVIIINYQ